MIRLCAMNIVSGKELGKIGYPTFHMLIIVLETLS